MKNAARLIAIFFALLIFICSFSALAIAERNIPSATSDFYVNDFAKLFSSAEKSQLMNNAVQLAKQYDGIQVVVTTVNSFYGMDIDSYANKMYNQYGIGKDDMGILILLSVGDRQIKIEVGLAMEAYITDSKAGRLLDEYAIPYLRHNDFSAGLIAVQDATISEIKTAIDKETSTKKQEPIVPDVGDSSKENIKIESEREEEEMNTFLFIGFIVCIVCGVFSIALIACLAVKNIHHRNEVDSLKEDNKEKDKIIKEFDARISRVRNEMMEKLKVAELNNQMLGQNISQLNKRIFAQEDTLRRANKLYPSLKDDIAKMIQDEEIQRDTEAGKKVDQIIAKVIDLPASKDIVDQLRNAIQAYNNLTTSQKKYVFADISRLRKLHEKCFALKKKFDREQEEIRNRENAKKAADSIHEKIDNISTGKESNLKQLKQAKSILEDLSAEELEYFDDELATRVKKLYKQAKQDEEENEMEERRRREREDEERRRMHSSYTHSSHSSFGGFSGFGGHSGGGGASRGF